MKSNLLTNILLLTLITLVIIFNFFPKSSNRYSMHFPQKSGFAYKVDHQTGQMWMLQVRPTTEEWKPWNEYEIGGNKIPLHVISDSSVSKSAP